MKRVGNLWASVTEFSNLFLAAKKAQKGKRFKPDVLKFNYNLEAELIELQQQLISRTYSPGNYTTFKIIDPKPRLISAAPYRDRVVHHALCNIIAPIFEKSFIPDSYANRVGFGTHKALKKFTQFARSSHYVLQCDISKYFPSIDHEILKQIIRKKIKCSDTLCLIDKIIDHSNAQEFVLAHFPGDTLLTPLERRKGLPLGNLTSQFFANIYLNQLDRFVKEKIRAKKYLRYVDDFALFSDDSDYLQASHDQIEVFLRDLRLKLHPLKTHLFKTIYGANFVGFRILNDRIRIISKNIRRGRKRIKILSQGITEGKWEQSKLKDSCQAWKGHLQHGDTYRLQQQLFGSLSF